MRNRGGSRPPLNFNVRAFGGCGGLQEVLFPYRCGDIAPQRSSRPSSKSRAPLTRCMVLWAPPRSGWCSAAQRFQAWLTWASLRRPERGRCSRCRATMASRSGCLPSGPQSALLRAGLRLPPPLRLRPFEAPPLPNPRVGVASGLACCCCPLPRVVVS